MINDDFYCVFLDLGGYTFWKSRGGQQFAL